jgi:hypothetical protein
VRFKINFETKTGADRMIRNHLKRNIIVFGFFAFLFIAAAGSVGAFPTQTLECGTSGCHDTRGVLTITSNSTSFNATTGTPFALSLQAGNGAAWIAIRNGWADNSKFAISQDEVQDGSVNDTNAASGAITATITFVPLSSGNLTIRIWTAAGGGVATPLDVVVNVTGSSITTYPTTSSGDSELILTWSVMIMVIPTASGVILLVLGLIVFRRKV